jgi:hypothetical protein
VTLAFLADDLLRFSMKRGECRRMAAVPVEKARSYGFGGMQAVGARRHTGCTRAPRRCVQTGPISNPWGTFWGTDAVGFSQTGRSTAVTHAVRWFSQPPAPEVLNSRDRMRCFALIHGQPVQACEPRFIGSQRPRMSPSRPLAAWHPITSHSMIASSPKKAG